MKTNPNDPAHPTPEMFDEVQVGVIYGLTKLEEFSARAMQGILANDRSANSMTFADIAGASVKQAKELIYQLNKED